MSGPPDPTEALQTPQDALYAAVAALQAAARILGPGCPPAATQAVLRAARAVDLAARRLRAQDT